MEKNNMDQENCRGCGSRQAVIVPTAKQLGTIEKYILQGKEVPSITVTEETEVYICRDHYCDLRSEFKPDKEWRYKKREEY